MTGCRDIFLRHFASRPDLAARVAEVEFSAEGCWLWPSSSYIKVGPRSNRQFLHRISLEIKLGRPLGTLHALHQCDQPRCCNPEHLRPGTHADNMSEMRARGRSRNRPTRGLANNKATLTDAQIGEALTMLASGSTITAVAGTFGVTRRAVTTWRDGTARVAARDAWLRKGSTSGNDGKPMRLRRWVR